MSSVLTSIYPARSSDRDRWILDRRPQRNSLDPSRPYAFFLEEEPSATGEVVPVATVLLTNRECPWRCLMCDLWKNTLTETVPDGAIPAQIEYALQHLPNARQIKLYNSGSFFDFHAIPLQDHRRIAEQVSSFQRVIVECHPALVGEDCFRFNDLLCGTLEVAMGLETAHPQILEKLNKRMTLQQFASAAEQLRRHNIALRIFILVKPPFMQEDEALEWANKSLDFAFDCGATAATLIPTRAGNGAIDHLADAGDFVPPQLPTLEASLKYGLSMNRGRVFADLWDITRLKACPYCQDDRIERLREMNLHQHVQDSVSCERCEGSLIG
jgi:radical SAM enzyme (TIGR01210 family)